MFEGYLFDLDGTIIDSEPWHKKTEIETFGRFGADLGPDDLLPFTGNTLPQLLAGMELHHGVRMSQDEFREHAEPLITTYIRERMERFEDAFDFICLLKGARKAIVTSSAPWYVDAVKIRFPEIFEAFDAILCQADVTHGKPHPEGYRLAASKLGTTPEKCVVFEDSQNGVRAGLAAGCYVVGVERHGRDWLQEAHRVVESFAELPYDFDSAS